MKTCPRCQQEKAHSEFRKRAKSKDGLQTYCITCVKAYDRARYETTDRPTDAKQRNILLRQRNISWLDEYLLDKKCVDCGTTDRRVFTFDHRDRSTKLGNISSMVRNSSLENLQAEVAKCDVRCANCHMIRTGEQFGWRHADYQALGKQ